MYLLSEQLGKDAVTRVHRLELENQRLQRELEAAKTDLAKVGVVVHTVLY